jgi:hypothetical protein
MEWLLALKTALCLLLIGDFVATFGYHVPEHVFGKFHSLVHHSPKRSFIRYAIKNRQPLALIDGFMSAFPYFLAIPFLWPLSPAGVILGLLLAEAHVIWRHQFPPAHPTPVWLKRCCQVMQITTPERHLIHHRYANKAFGDIFAFYGKPAEIWLKQLQLLRQCLNQSFRQFH